MALFFVGMLGTHECCVPFISSLPPQKPIPQKQTKNIENSYQLDWILVAHQWTSITNPIQLGHERKDFLRKPSFLLLPGKQQLRHNHNFRGMKEDELVERCALRKTLI